MPDKLRGHLLLMHGTTDNNVHVGNMMQLAMKLLSAGKPFDMISFPESRHGVPGDRQAQLWPNT